MQTAHDQKTGRIELPNNEFSNDPMLQPSIDTMYYACHAFYDEVTCSCGRKWWRKEVSDRSSQCGVCYSENIAQLLKMNKDNL